MQGWTDTIKFLNDIGLLPLVLLLLAIPVGMLLVLIIMKRYLFGKFSVTAAWEGWLADQKARTQIEVKLEERLDELVEQIKQILAANWDTRRYFDDVLERSKADHTTIITHLENLLLLAKKRRSD